MDIFLIPDGNRRWSKKHKKETWEGYSYLPKIINLSIKTLLANNIKKFHFHGNSINNLNRGEKEVRSFLDSYLEIPNATKDIQNGVRIYLRGNLALMPFDYKERFELIEDKSKNNTGFDLYLYLNYTSQDDLQRAIIKSGSVVVEKILPFMDEPEQTDIIIKTGYRQNLSGFNPIRSTNSVIQFENCYAPDLTAEHIEKAIKTVKEFDYKNGL